MSDRHVDKSSPSELATVTPPDPFVRFWDAVSDVAWRQWRAIGGSAGAVTPAHNIVDPEALVCLSIALTVYVVEPRAWNVLHGWVDLNSRMLSVQRLRTLIKDYPDAVQQRLGILAQSIEAKDPRWRTLAAKTPVQPMSFERHRATEPPLKTGAAMMLRLRLAMGMNVKADALTVLLGLQQTGATVTELVEATRYAPISLRQAVEEMGDAGVLRVSSGRPARYYVQRDTWEPLIGQLGDAQWMPWHDTFVFAIKLSQWHKRTIKNIDSPYLRSRDLRDLVEPMRTATVRYGLLFRDPKEFVGAAYASVFEEDLVEAAHWVRNHV